MDLNTCEKATDMRDQPGQEVKLTVPQSVGQAVEHKGMETRVKQEHLKSVTACGISVQDCLNVMPDRAKHGFTLFSLIIRIAVRPGPADIEKPPL